MDYKKELSEMADELEVFDCASKLLDDNRFERCSGSSLKHQHHYGTGGLMKHVHEVVELSNSVCEIYPNFAIDKRELFLSCLYHDAGKMYDYECVAGHWRGTDHKRYIHHISRSALIWSKHGAAIFDSEFVDKVLHAILSHHMSREFGSPVAPKSRVAWILTLCDNLSARVNDCDTWDVIREKNK